MVKKTMVVRAQDDDVDGGGAAAFATRYQMRPFHVSVEAAKLTDLWSHQKIGIVDFLGVSSGLVRARNRAAMLVVALKAAKLTASFSRTATNCIGATILGARRFLIKFGLFQTNTPDGTVFLPGVAGLEVEHGAASLARRRTVRVSGLVSQPLPVAGYGAKELSAVAFEYGSALHAWSGRPSRLFAHAIKHRVPSAEAGIPSLDLLPAPASAKRQRSINYGFDGGPEFPCHDGNVGRESRMSLGTGSSISTRSGVSLGNLGCL